MPLPSWGASTLAGPNGSARYGQVSWSGAAKQAVRHGSFGPRARQVGVPWGPAGRRSIVPWRSKGTKGKRNRRLAWVGALGWVQRALVISFSSNRLLPEVDQTQQNGRGEIGPSATWSDICFPLACSAPYSPLEVVSHFCVKSTLSILNCKLFEEFWKVKTSQV